MSATESKVETSRKKLAIRTLIEWTPPFPNATLAAGLLFCLTKVGTPFSSYLNTCPCGNKSQSLLDQTKDGEPHLRVGTLAICLTEAPRTVLNRMPATRSSFNYDRSSVRVPLPKTRLPTSLHTTLMLALKETFDE